MAKYVQPGHNIDYVNGGDTKISAGDVVVLGNRIGVAATDIAAGATGSVATCGVFEFDKATGAMALGDCVYWDATNKKITSTASSNTPAGYVIKAQVSADTKVLVSIGEAKKAANCAVAAGTAPTKAEFDAVITALINAGLMAPASV